MLSTISDPAFPVLAVWLNGPQSTFDVAGPVARSQLGVFYVTLWVTGFIFVVVASVMAYATYRFRARPASGAHKGLPPQSHGNPKVEFALIGASVCALIIIAVPTLRALVYTYEVPAADLANAYEINATGFQWWFKFEYPTELVDLPDNAGKAPLTVANELVIPAGRPIHINLRTYDVIHSFWVPKLAGKVDMIPNRGNHLWLQADKPGYFWGQCAEFCGESHAVMRFRVIALGEREFAAWLANQKQNARETTAAKVEAASRRFSESGKMPLPLYKRNAPGWSESFDANPLQYWREQQLPPAPDSTSANPALIAQGRKLFTEKTCITCHVIRGHHTGGAPFAPDLTHEAARTTIAGGVLENTDANLYRWITDPNGVKPGNKMFSGVGGMVGYMQRDADGRLTQTHISLTDAEARALVAYLHSLK